MPTSEKARGSASRRDGGDRLDGRRLQARATRFGPSESRAWARQGGRLPICLADLLDQGSGM